MIWHLVAAIVVGVAAAGVALFLRKISGKRLPKWIIPVFAGVGMLAYQVHTEYDWFDHKKMSLPEGSVVVSTEEPGSPWRPWTFAIPMTTAFTVLDEASINSRMVSNQKVIEFMLYRFEKQHVDRVKNQAFVINCDRRELLPMNLKRELDIAEGRVLGEEDPLYQVICR
ncbi:hypothetical protein [Oceanospirillum maris]|uniref:hypothetical protein n=1 Tax=Oceanospirillum maris TaxID=64977 RepID=UPI0004234419|nr:hypothetical protein [Oceanospirillum maris]